MITNIPCEPDNNGECLVCDAWPSNCAYQRYLKHDYSVETKEELETMFNKYKMKKETIIYRSDANWSRKAYIKFVDNKVEFDCSDEEYGPITFATELFVKAYQEHYDIDTEFSNWDTTLMDGLENEPPYVSDDFQIGPDGAYEATEEVRTIQIQQELINLLEMQLKDLALLSPIKLSDDVIAEIKRLKSLLND
jgi:hypothetical protein